MLYNCSNRNNGNNFPVHYINNSALPTPPSISTATTLSSVSTNTPHRPDFKYDCIVNYINLWRAVIAEIATCLKSDDNKNDYRRSLRNDAILWFDVNNSDFKYVCQLADYDPNYVIRLINMYRKKALKKHIKTDDLFFNLLIGDGGDGK
jgi:hypothetical protein